MIGVPLAAGIALVGIGLVFERIYLLSLRISLHSAELIVVAAEPEQVEYPPTPIGPDNIAMWDAHHEEFDRVRQRNRALLDEWLHDRVAQGEARQKQLDALRESACEPSRV